MRLLPPELTVSLLWARQPAPLESDELRAVGKWASWELPRRLENRTGVQQSAGFVHSFSHSLIYELLPLLSNRLIHDF